MISVPESINAMSYKRMQWLTFSRDVAANSNSSGTVSISDDGDFICHYLGGQFTTLTGAAADGGACTMSIKIHDNGKRWEIIDNLTPMSLFCNPGRQRTSGVAGDPSNPLFYPIEFPYIFGAGTSIRIEYANSAAFQNTFWLVFYGEKEFIPEKFTAPVPES